ncbi:MAG: ferritin family protein [Candidatus Aerophobetes bacterium]|nr:ferritin family protein [Candidatus Aerophobetes bacterium]
MSIFFSVQEVVEMAISTERSGQAFYQTASKSAKKKNLRELLQYLAEEEEKHLKTFQGLYDKLKEREEPAPYNWEEAKLYLKALIDSRFFTGPDKAIQMAREAKSEIEALNSAISFEKETLLFFYEMLEVVSPPENDLVKKIIQEEKKHIRKLSSMKSRLTQHSPPQG